MTSFSFIHTADIHLGSTIQLGEEYTSEQEEQLLAEANFNAFTNLVDAAIREQVDFLLIAGDLYDQEQRSIKANQFFKQQCQRLNEHQISIYVISGNHDPISSRRELFTLPDNVTQFSAQEVEEYQLEIKDNKKTVNLLGQSYQYCTQRDPLHLNYQSTVPDLFNIALLHTQLESNNSNYSPVSKTELAANKAVDYWALGHIHQCQIKKSDNPVIAYPGIPQGRDFGEQSLGGCLLVEVTENNQIKQYFLATANLVWRRIEINLDRVDDEITNLDQLLDLIQAKAKDLAQTLPDIPNNLATVDDQWQLNFNGYLVEWIITGAGVIDEVLKEQPEEAANSLVSKLNNLDLNPYFVITTGVKFNTTPLLPNLEELAQDNAVFKELKEVIEMCNSELKEELAREIGEIWQHEVDHEDLEPTQFQLSANKYQSILEQAKNLIITELIESRD